MTDIINVHKAPSYLSDKNPHDKDKFIEFQEIGHLYYIHGEKGYTSITTLISKLFEHFDANKIIDKMFIGKKMLDPTYKYYGMTRESIIDLWDANGKDASMKGTAMHENIEKYYNNMTVHDESIEYGFFRKFTEDYKLIPFRTEWTVFYTKYKLCGSIDMIFENPDGTLQIYDWKRVKSIEYEAFGNKTSIIPCLKHMPDTNFWHYSLQLNLYKTILEEQYGKKVTDLYLVCMHPDNTSSTYDRIQVPILSDEVSLLLSSLNEIIVN